MLGRGSRDSAAENCFAAFDKAIKTYRLYDGRGELCSRAVETFYGGITTYLENEPRLSFTLTGQGFRHGDQILSAEDRSGQGYFQMFKDGLRQLTFLHGLSSEEAERLVRVLSIRNKVQEQDAAAEDSDERMEEDTVTRLWEANFHSVRYDAIDSFVEGDVFVPELDKKVSLAQWVGTKMEAYGEELIDEWQRTGPPLKSSPVVPGVQDRALLDLSPPAPISSDRRHAFRAEFEQNDSSQMERFSVIWGQLVERAGEAERRPLIQMMIGLINEWMDEGNWSGLLRTFKVLRELARKEAFQSLVSLIVQSVASPTGLLRLKPHLAEIHPRTVSDALQFHLLLGRPGLESLCRMLADLPPGPIIDAFDLAFQKEKVNPMGLYLARLRSRETLPVVHAVRKLAGAIQNPMVVKAIRQAVVREEREIRNAALSALKGDRDPATLTGLGRAVFDPEARVRLGAIDALGKAGHPIGLQALRERLDDRDFRSLDTEERSAIFQALCRLADEGTWDILAEWMGKSRMFGGKNIRAIQAEIAEALSRTDRPEAQALFARFSSRKEKQEGETP